MSSPQLNQSDKSADRARLNIQDGRERENSIPWQWIAFKASRSSPAIRVSGGPGNDVRLNISDNVHCA
jgi:hypothetical protein